jgi:hypothetical protein
MKPKTPKPHWLHSNAPALIAFFGIIGSWFLLGDILIVMVLAMFAGIFSIIGWAAHTVAVKQRPRISLSTALILLFVASGFLFLNTRPSTDSATHARAADDGKLFTAQAIHYGWPVGAVTHYIPASGDASRGYSAPHIPAIMLNTVVALAVLVPVGYFCEKKLRPKPANPIDASSCTQIPATRD